MLKGMVTFILEKGQIETTYARAKEVSALTDKMITLGKANTLAAKRQAMSFLKKEGVVSKLFNVIAPIYDERNGGYTRVLKIGPRRGDGAEMAIITMVDADSVYAPKDKKAKKAEKAAESTGDKVAEKKPSDKKDEKEKSTAPKKSAAKKPAKKTEAKKEEKPKTESVEVVSDDKTAEESTVEEAKDNSAE
jgi:large subunit ribosomal protein L17